MLYKLVLTKEEQKKIGFHYDFTLNEYVYEFPVYKSKYASYPLVCKLSIEEDTNLVIINVYNANGFLYSPYYNRTYCGRSDVIKAIDSHIIEQLKYLGAEEVVKEQDDIAAI